MTEVSWIKQLYHCLMGHEKSPVLIVATPLADDQPVKPVSVVVPAKQVAETMRAVTETHHQSIGRAYVEGMLACRADKDSSNPYYRTSEQGRAYDSGYRDEGLR